MMKHLIFIITLLLCSITYAQSTGDIDTDFGNFGGNGKVIINYDLGGTQGDETGAALDQINSNGSNYYLIGGSATISGSDDQDMVLTKLYQTGLRVNNWGNHGTGLTRVFFNIGGDQQDLLRDIIVYDEVGADYNDYIFLIGSARYSGVDTDFAIAKIVGDTGNLDTSFSYSDDQNDSNDGKLTVGFDSGGDNIDEANSAYKYGDFLYVAGYATQSTGTDFAITKIHADTGVIDTTFGTNGKLTIDFANSTSSIDNAFDINMADDGTLWVFGESSENDGSSSPAIANISTTGNLVTSFSNDGKYVVPDSRAGSSINDAVYDNQNDRVVFVGKDTHPENTNLKDDCAITLVNMSETNASGEPVFDSFNFQLDPNPSLFNFNSSCATAAFPIGGTKIALTGNLYTDSYNVIITGVLRFNSMSVTQASSIYSIDNDFGDWGNGRVAYQFDYTGNQQVVDSPRAIMFEYHSTSDILVTGSATISDNLQKIGIVRLIGAAGEDPTVTVTTPSNNSSYALNTQITFSGTANDMEDGNISNDIKWNSNHDGYLGMGASITDYLSIGNHIITAEITDSNGQTDYDSINVEITEILDDPVVTITSPSDNSNFNEGDTINFSATAIDDEDGDISSSISWYSNNEGQIPIGTGASFSISTLAAGQHVITAQVVDSHNQTGHNQITIDVSIVLDDPVVSITSPANNATFVAGEVINFAGSAIDDEDGNLTSSMVWYSAHDGNIGYGGSFTESNLTVAEQIITAQVTDSHGHTGFKQITIHIIQNSDIIFKNGFDQP